MLFDIKEISRFQMRITLFIVGINGINIGSEFNFFCGIKIISFCFYFQVKLFEIARLQ